MSLPLDVMHNCACNACNVLVDETRKISWQVCGSKPFEQQPWQLPGDHAVFMHRVSCFAPHPAGCIFQIRNISLCRIEAECGWILAAEVSDLAQGLHNLLLKHLWLIMTHHDSLRNTICSRQPGTLRFVFDGLTSRSEIGSKNIPTS